jgi:protein required for attachment to host cells
MGPTEYANDCYCTHITRLRNSEQRRLRHCQPAPAARGRQDHHEQQRGQQQQQDYESASHYYYSRPHLEEEERANMTGIVRAKVDNYCDRNSYAHIVAIKKPRTLVEQRIEFWQQ